MADIQNFTVTIGANQSITMARRIISFEIRDSQTGALLIDKTGANAFTFPGDVANLPADRRAALVDAIGEAVVAWIHREVQGFNP